MPEYVACNLCRSDDARFLFSLRDYRLCVDDIEWRVVQCRRCGLGYLNPRPTREEIGRYYPEEYFEQRGSQLERYRRQAEYIDGPPRRLLDVGTARGDFLAVMSERGWDAAGIEVARDAGNPHDLTIHRMRFPEECSLPAGSFDVITAWAVFEHLHDPRAAFAACARMLRPGGELVVQVPNLNSVWSRGARQEDVPRHVYFFTARTLRQFGRIAGLRLRKVVHTTDLFGGSGRGVLRLALVRAVGGSTSDFFEMWRTPRRERLRRWPLLTQAWLAAAAVEEIVLSDWLVRTARISGQIVAYFDKPVARGLPTELVAQKAA
jgi:SAM-dependent methyltransferase